MKMSYETKQKIARQRKRRMKEFFNNFDVGSVICFTDVSYVCPRCAYILGCHEHVGEYYYVLGTAQGDIFIGKVVYSSYLDVIKIPEHTKKYKNNKEVFECWINEAQERREKDIQNYYNAFVQLHNGRIIPYKIIICEDNNISDAVFCLKKEFNNKYYFVVKLLNGNYAIAQIGWKNGAVRGIILTDKEFDDNKEVFKLWVVEAKKNSMKKYENA